MSSSNEEFAVSDNASQTQLMSSNFEDGDDKLKPLDTDDKMPESQVEINKDPAQPQSADGPSDGLPGPQQATCSEDVPGGVHDQQKSQPILSDTKKYELIQEQLQLYLHAQRCQLRENILDERKCNLPHCKIIKNVLIHMSNCQAGKDCTVAHCYSARQIIGHWKYCATKSCPICLPRKRNSTFNLVGVNPTSPDIQRTPSFADIKRAYDAIVIAVPSTSGAAGVAATAATGNTQQDYDIRYLQLPGCQPGHLDPTFVQATKEWQRTFSSDLRSRLVYKLLIAIFPNPSPETFADPRILGVMECARNFEVDAYKVANSRSQYYHRLAYHILRIRKDINEQQRRRIERLQLQQQQLSTSSGTTTV
ncbi:CREB-binding protein-like [Nasonia vitripennis]|uniref:histone acetyltransferase n=1 Tax=Nasonia vitripennis TaxID=7425 RepID=A0A7M7GD76_NASVI|nr:CREB-binding protein-like [Nasonia vitripennis]